MIFSSPKSYTAQLYPTTPFAAMPHDSHLQVLEKGASLPVTTISGSRAQTHHSFLQQQKASFHLVKPQMLASELRNRARTARFCHLIPNMGNKLHCNSYNAAVLQSSASTHMLLCNVLAQNCKAFNERRSLE